MTATDDRQAGDLLGGPAGGRCVGDRGRGMWPGAAREALWELSAAANDLTEAAEIVAELAYAAVLPPSAANLLVKRAHCSQVGEKLACHLDAGRKAG